MEVTVYRGQKIGLERLFPCGSSNVLTSIHSSTVVEDCRLYRYFALRLLSSVSLIEKLLAVVGQTMGKTKGLTYANSASHVETVWSVDLFTLQVGDHDSVSSHTNLSVKWMSEKNDLSILFPQHSNILCRLCFYLRMCVYILGMLYEFCLSELYNELMQ